MADVPPIEPGESTAQYEARVRAYRHILEQGYGEVLADLFSRIRTNMDFLGAKYDETTTEYANLLTGSIKDA